MKSKEATLILMVCAALFSIWGLFTMLGQPEQILGGDAYNYLTAAGRGTGLICMGVVCAVLANALNPRD
jgi:hypothetical protein